MDDKDVRAFLRAAVSAKILHGWYNYNTSRETRWCITSFGAPANDYGFEEIRTYCLMLREAGIEPQYIGSA
jgi:hypothetical protein